MKRLTRHRKVIKEIIYKYRDHPTAEEIYLRARMEIPSINLSTVYRNLKEMVASGDLIEFQIDGENKYRYDIAEEHYHFYCEVCGKIYDIPANKVKLSFDFEHHVKDTRIMFRGICSECAAQMEVEDESL